MRSPAARLAILCGALWGASLAPGSARADLVADGDDVQAHLRKLGLSVTRAESVFVQAGPGGDAATVVRPPPGVLAALSRCTTLVLVAPRPASFSAARQAQAADDPNAHDPNAHDPDADARANSEGGVALLSRCGTSRSELARVRVEHASRGAIEVLWANGPDPVASVLGALPERDPGAGHAPRELLPPHAPELSFAARVDRAERRSKGARAGRQLQLETRAGPAGKGALLVQLTAGCHRLDVIAEGARVDVDAEVHLGDRLLSKDQGEAADASLELCVAASEAVTVSYQGAPPDAKVALVVSRWALPSGLPEAWPPIARAALARTMRRRGLGALPDRAVAHVLAVHGETRVPLPVEPGRCYLVAAAALEPGLRLLRLQVEGLRGAHRDEALRDTSAALAAFCTEDEASLTLELDARGAWTAAALWVLE